MMQLPQKCKHVDRKCQQRQFVWNQWRLLASAQGSAIMISRGTDDVSDDLGPGHDDLLQDRWCQQLLRTLQLWPLGRHSSRVSVYLVITSQLIIRVCQALRFLPFPFLLQFSGLLGLVVLFHPWLNRKVSPGDYIVHWPRWFPAVLFPPRLHSSQSQCPLQPGVVGGLSSSPQ